MATVNGIIPQQNVGGKSKKLKRKPKQNCSTTQVQHTADPKMVEHDDDDVSKLEMENQVFICVGIVLLNKVIIGLLINAMIWINVLTPLVGYVLIIIYIVSSLLICLLFGEILVSFGDMVINLRIKTIIDAVNEILLQKLVNWLVILHNCCINNTITMATNGDNGKFNELLQLVCNFVISGCFGFFIILILCMVGVNTMEKFILGNFMLKKINKYELPEFNGELPSPILDIIINENEFEMDKLDEKQIDNNKDIVHIQNKNKKKNKNKNKNKNRNKNLSKKAQCASNNNNNNNNNNSNNKHNILNEHLKIENKLSGGANGISGINNVSGKNIDCRTEIKIDNQDQLGNVDVHSMPLRNTDNKNITKGKKRRRNKNQNRNMNKNTNKSNNVAHISSSGITNGVKHLKNFETKHLQPDFNKKHLSSPMNLHCKNKQNLDINQKQEQKEIIIGNSPHLPKWDNSVSATNDSMVEQFKQQQLQLQQLLPILQRLTIPQQQQSQQQQQQQQQHHQVQSDCVDHDKISISDSASSEHSYCSTDRSLFDSIDGYDRGIDDKHSADKIVPVQNFIDDICTLKQRYEKWPGLYIPLALLEQIKLQRYDDSMVVDGHLVLQERFIYATALGKYYPMQILYEDMCRLNKKYKNKIGIYRSTLEKLVFTLIEKNFQSVIHVKLHSLDSSADDNSQTHIWNNNNNTNRNRRRGRKPYYRW